MNWTDSQQRTNPMIPTLRPSVRFLSDALIKKIVDESYLLLERVGVFVENAEAVNLLRQAGARVDDIAGRVYIPGLMVARALETAPRSIELFDAAGEGPYHIGGDVVHFDPGSAALRIFDH